MLAHGVPTRVVDGQDVVNLQCTWAQPSSVSGAQPLQVSAEATGTKAENTVGHFVAPVTGRIHVDCAGWGAMFVPDSTDRAFDWAGLALLVAVVALTVGGALGLGELRLATERRQTRTAEDEIEDEAESAGEPVDQA